MAVDYYEILGVSREAGREEIKRAYRRLARQHHPDVNHSDPESEERFKRISEAYAVLSDEQKRRQYDLRGSGADLFGNGMPNIWEIFESAFSGSAFGGEPFRAQAQAESIQATVTLELADVLDTTQHEVSYRRIMPCGHCEGQGIEPGSSLRRCTTCRGQGRVSRTVTTFLGTMSSVSPCPQCAGRGEVPEQLCTRCRGQGAEEREAAVTVEIPPGVNDGEQLRVRGGGHHLPGALPGDLLLRIRVKPHPRFTRRGQDLELTQEVHYLQALLGDTLAVPTLTAETEVPLPAGTQPGQRLEVPGEGLPDRHGRRGRLLINLQITFPRQLSEREQELLGQLAEEANLQVKPPPRGLFERLRESLGG